MKKFFLTLALIIGFISFAGAQITQSGLLPIRKYTDTISGAETHTYDYTGIFQDAYLFGVSIYSDHITGSSDSADVYLQGSFDGASFFTVKSAATYATRFHATDAYINLYSSSSTDVWFYPYMRVSITHYATGTARYWIRARMTKALINY